MFKTSLLAALAASSPMLVGEEPQEPRSDVDGIFSKADFVTDTFLMEPSEETSLSAAISCLAKGMDEEGVIYKEDMTPYDEHDLLEELRFPLKKAQRDSLIDIDHEYSLMVNEKVEQLEKSSRGSYDKVAEEILKEMVAAKMLHLPQNAKKANQIKNLIAKDVRWEVLKKQNVEKMLEKFRIQHKGETYYLDAEKSLEANVKAAFKKVCLDDGNYKDTREVLGNPDFLDVVIYTNPRDFFIENKKFFSNLGYSESHVSETSGMILPKIFMRDGEPSVGLSMAINLAATKKESLLEETIRHEKDHAKHILRNGLPIDYLANPTHHSLDKEEELRKEIEKCARNLELKEDITRWQASQVLGRLLHENDTAEGLAEAIENIPSYLLQKYCRKVFEFSFGDPSKLRDCEADISSATAETLLPHEREI